MISRALRGFKPRSLRQLNGQLLGFIKARLWLQVLVAMFLGVVVGILLGPSAGLVTPEFAALLTSWLALPGYLFLALIQMIVIPLVFASIVLGMAAGENLDYLRKVGFKVVGFFLLTTIAAVAIGVGVALTLKPGERVDAAGLT
ncbi:MAG: cation:dicarboxylate symporter family transporter, partial [Wenzhouxiangella sp.]